jgi:O-antigen/teichoic acid export membrane protein
MSDKKNIIKNSAWSLLFRIISATSGLFLTAFLARSLSQTEAGGYFILLSFASIVGVILGFGTNLSSVRLIAASEAKGTHGETKGTVITALVIILLLSALFSIVVYFTDSLGLLNGYSNFEDGLTSLLVIWSIALAGQTVTSEFWRGLNKIALASIFGGVLASVCTVTAIIISVFFAQLTLKTVIFVSALSAASSAICSIILLTRALTKLPSRPKYQYKAFLKLSFPLWITNLMLVVLQQADLWLVNTLADQADVALYASASRLTQLLTLPLLVINSAVIPLISASYARAELNKLELILRTSAALASFPALVSMMLFIVGGKTLLINLFGGNYEHALPFLLILGTGQVVNILCGSSGYTLMMTGRQTDMMWITLLAGLFMVCFAWFLGRHYGAIGVAYASTAALSLQSLAMCWRVYAKSEINTFANLSCLVRPIKALKVLR